MKNQKLFHKDFLSFWKDLEKCSARGIHYYNEDKRNMEYQSYSELYSFAGKTAAKLSQKGIGKGEKVLLSSGTSLLLVQLWLAHIWLGASVVPMPPKEAMTAKEAFKNRLNHILPYFKYYICQDSEKEEIESICKSVHCEIHIILYSEIFDSEELPGIPASADIDPEALAFIQFTSGSTSWPKGVMIRYRNLFANIGDLWNRVQINTEKNKIGSWLPLYHDMGLIGYMLGGLLTQTELYLISPMQFAKRPIQFLTLLSEKQIEICSMPNFAIEWILRRYDPEQDYQINLKHLKWIGIGAEPINIKKLNEFEDLFKRYQIPSGVISPCYGLAEATLAVSIAHPYEPFESFELKGLYYPTNGELLDTTEIKIEKEHPEDDFGIIKIKGKSVAEEALIDGKIVKLLDPDGYYNTQDIGLLFHGKLVVLGRYDDMFIVNGENYFPNDIESYIRSFILLSRNRVACFHVSSADLGSDELIVLYETSKMNTPENDSVKKEIDHVIKENTGLIATVIAVEPKTILVTPSGKIQRSLMRNLYREGKFKPFI